MIDIFVNGRRSGVRMDKNRIKEKIIQLGSIGRSSQGGINRVFGSNDLNIAQSFVKDYMQEAGMESWIDPIGNVHGLYNCPDSSAQTILTGSHIDTVQDGGMLDGVLGLVGAVECVRELHFTHSPLKHHIHVIATNGEEGNDLGGTVGSRTMMGLLDYHDPDFLKKAAQFHFKADDFEKAQIDTSHMKCYLELHIEQGNTLELNHKDIGIVTGIVGLERYLLSVNGINNHAGTTMMSNRKDALVEAAQIILMVDSLARELKNHFVATVGKLKIYPNSVAVIPGLVELVLEFRNQNQQLMDRFIDVLQQRVKNFADVDYSLLIKKSPVNCSPYIVQCVQEICMEKHIRYCTMPSGATHDGNAMASQMPIGMIFVPSRDGISHNRLEWTDWNQIYTGIEILYYTLKKLGEADEVINY